MSSSEIYLHGELNDFLSNDNPKGRVLYPLNRKASIKDVLESLGPPHTEIAHICSNGAEIDFRHHLSPGEEIQAFPHTPPIDLSSPNLLRPYPLKEIRFVVDVNVGKLAKFLRVLGYDTAYHWQNKDQEIARLAETEQRIVLTKDINLLKRNKIVWARYVRSFRPEDQLREILNFFNLKPPYDLFSRCLCCNIRLNPVDKQKILHRLEPKTKKYFYKFSICPNCQRIYWAGSHQEKMLSWLSEQGINIFD